MLKLTERRQYFLSESEMVSRQDKLPAAGATQGGLHNLPHLLTVILIIAHTFMTGLSGQCK